MEVPNMNDLKLLKYIIDHAPVGVLVSDNTGNIIKTNLRHSMISGIDEKELIGRNLQDMVNEGFLHESSSMKVIESKSPMIFEQTVNPETSNEHNVIVQALPFTDSSGEIKYIINYLLEMTSKDLVLNHFNEALFDSQQYLVELQQLRSKAAREQAFVYRSPIMDNLFSKAQRVAQIDSTVLITGESGTGKTILAKHIHAQSLRCNNTFLTLNCSALPESLIESELFGYEAGAFTGAKEKGKKGMFEYANGGTLFLDEIGEMPLEAQAKILSVLQDGEFYKIGGVKPIKTNARIIAATNADLQQKMQNNTFRKDLYYRLNVISFEIPPLRQRPEDIPLLVDHFTKIFNKKHNLNRSFSPQAINEISSLPFYGNVRELQNLIERTMIFSLTDIISSLDSYQEDEVSSGLHSGTVSISATKATRSQHSVEAERKMFEAAALHCNTTIAVAKYLGISQPTASRKLRKYKISLKK